MKYKERRYTLFTSNLRQLWVGGKGRVLIVKYNERGYTLSTSNLGQLWIGVKGRVVPQPTVKATIKK